MTEEERIDFVLRQVRKEILDATSKFGAFHSTHEGYAVIKEELDELWDEVRRNDADRSCCEALQVAAMGVRYIVDLGKWVG